MRKPTIAIMPFNNVPSIYVPRVHNSVTWQDMKAVFEEILGEDTIHRVDIVKIKPKEGQKPPAFNRAYVHIKKWLPENEFVRDSLLAGESCKIVYDEPHYWLCLLNKAEEKPRAKPHLVMSDESGLEPVPVTPSNTLEQYMPDNLKGKYVPRKEKEWGDDSASES